VDPAAFALLAGLPGHRPSACHGNTVLGPFPFERRVLVGRSRIAVQAGIRCLAKEGLPGNLDAEIISVEGHKGGVPVDPAGCGRRVRRRARVGDHFRLRGGNRATGAGQRLASAGPGNSCLGSTRGWCDQSGDRRASAGSGRPGIGSASRCVEAAVLTGTSRQHQSDDEKARNAKR
jgi:hypothetical protein